LARRSIGFPLTIGIVLCVLALALAVGWQLLVVSDLLPVARGLTAVHWAMVIAGSVFFLLLIVGMVLLCAWLVREMRFNQRQQAFLDAVTHEMKTPLASLGLYLDTLAARDPAPDQRRQFLPRMREDVERLTRTVGHVLAVARAEERVRAPVREPVDLAQVLAGCIADLRARHAPAPAAVQLECQGPAVVLGDENEFALVFGNLLDNAVKYSQDTVRVTVELASPAPDTVWVRVKDRGVGVPRRQLRRIFNRFYRFQMRGVSVKGTGLGLYMVRSIARQHGGRAFAESDGEGRGSTFTLELPKLAPRDAT
jgi:signal transduction histidine kinase